MKTPEGMPTAINIPELRINIEGLKRHSLMCVFFSDTRLSDNDRKLRTWLLHTTASAARHYTKARELVNLQDNTDQQRDGGAIFYILDVSEQIEDCISALFRVCSAIKRLRPNERAAEFCEQHTDSIEMLSKVRNQFEHMHLQITANETGNGPISITFGNEGKSINYRSRRIETNRVRELIESAFRLVADLYPSFDPTSVPETGGPVKLIATMTVNVIDK